MQASRTRGSETAWVRAMAVSSASSTPAKASRSSRWFCRATRTGRMRRGSSGSRAISSATMKSKRACKIVGAKGSGCFWQCLAIVCGPEARIVLTEGVLERAVQHGRAHVKEGLHGRLAPAHLLRLVHPLGHDLVDRTLHKGGRDRLPPPAPTRAVQPPH